LILSALLLLLSYVSFSQAGNDACSNATTLYPGYTCSPTTGNLRLANTTNVTGTGNCGSRADVWYRFTVPANSTSVTITVTLTSSPSTLTTANTFIERLTSNSCPGTGTSAGSCNSIASPVTYSGLTAGATYLFRVYTTAAVNGATGTYNFNICATSQNNCSGAVTVVPGVTLDQILRGNPAVPGASPLDCTNTSPDDVVWYKFTAVLPYATIVAHNIGSDLSASGVRLQLFSGGACGSLTSIACGSTTINATGLVTGNVYYFRAYSAGTGQTGTNWGYRISVFPTAPVEVTAGRMNEVYDQQIISAPQLLADPWEVIYGPDNMLWITEAKGYRVYKVNPTTGVRDTILDISQNSTFLPLADRTFNCQFSHGSVSFQGGCAGMALHPQFLDATSPKNYVYLSYGYSQTSSNVFVNRIARFTYNTSTGKLETPVAICDTIPGSNDHNSQRMIITPVGGTYYLFYAAGDMGAGQFANVARVNKAQMLNSYEGKILRFNLEPDGDADARNSWIPSTGTGDETNPYNATLGVQSAVWSVGIRNNQGFVYDAELDKLYGSSHGPFSDDEINIIERGKNYGHPLVIGFADGNANGTTAGAAPGMSGGCAICTVINDEVANATTIGISYKDPLFSAYKNSIVWPTLKGLWDVTTGANATWPSEGWSGLDLYTHTLIPGWKKSLVASSLKWGRLVKIRLNSNGIQTAPSNTVADTTSYFGSINRFRDVAFSPDGKNIYVVMDRSTSSSGPSAANPIIPACQGCLQRYTFLGYADASGKSSIPTSIDVTTGTDNACNTGTTVTIDNTNNDKWVPVTGPDGNIMAEIYSNGQNLGTVTSSFYKNAGPIRTRNNRKYLDRNLTITPQTQPAGNVKIRLYFSKAEYDALDADPLSQVTSLADVKIHKNNDPCRNGIQGNLTVINPVYSETHGGNGYMLQADNISSFSSFYFGATTLALPLNLVSFTGMYRNEISYLHWETDNEVNTDYFVVERSIGNSTYEPIGTVFSKGGSNQKTKYALLDKEAATLGVDKLYYRLRITDKDGSYSYSNIVTINIPGNFVTHVSVFPNPTDKQAIVILSSPKEQRINWQLVDIAGRVVMSKEVIIKKGDNRIILDMQKLNAGVYYLQVRGPFVNALEKIQKL
jgi:PQQ-dependent dehydrogenase (s-GDH family)